MENIAARMRQTGIENCWFLQRKAQFALQTVRIYVRDWKGERILKKCAKTNACVWSEAKAVALKSPTRTVVELAETK